MVDYSRYKQIKVEKKDKVAVATLNRPDALNAVAPEMHAELEEFFTEVTRDDEVNAIVLTAAGRAFSAGGDIRGMHARLTGPFSERVRFKSARHLVHTILEVEQPIIAAVNGDAVGLGATLALMCDVIIASDKARFGDPHVRVGIVAGDGGAVIWPLLCGLAKAKEMLMTGDLISATEAERIGLVNHVVPLEQVLPKAMDLAQRLANGPTRAIRWTKLACNKRLRDEVNLVLDASLAVEFLTFFSDDHKEAVQAFLEKRTPRYTGA